MDKLRYTKELIKKLYRPPKQRTIITSEVMRHHLKGRFTWGEGQKDDREIEQTLIKVYQVYPLAPPLPINIFSSLGGDSVCNYKPKLEFADPLSMNLESIDIGMSYEYNDKVNIFLKGWVYHQVIEFGHRSILEEVNIAKDSFNIFDEYIEDLKTSKNWEEVDWIQKAVNKYLISDDIKNIFLDKIEYYYKNKPEKSKGICIYVKQLIGGKDIFHYKY